MLYIPCLASPADKMGPLLRHLLIAATLLTAACRSGSRPDLEADGSVAFACQRQNCTPDPHGICQHTCTPDPGPRLVKCADAEAPFEFAKPYIWTFEEPNPLNRARAMYSYTDNSQSIATFFASDGGRQTYQPPTAVLPRCSDVPNPMNRAIHIQGGPFLSWGGGVGTAMKDHPGRTIDAGTPLTFPLSPGSTAISGAAIDASQWEGISFWARRGPDSQAGFRVLVGDKYTDDDIAYRMYRDDPTVPRFCERVRECACLNHKTCAPIQVEVNASGRVTSPPDFLAACVPVHLNPSPPTTLSMTFCGEPALLSAGSMGSGAGSGTTQCNTCQETRCNEPYPAYPDDFPAPGGTQPTDPTTGAPINVGPAGTDRQFVGKTCNPYTLRPGISTSFCFDPATERPAEATEQCGDHWTRVVNLSNEWQFYTVPFSAMGQQGWAKRSPGLDLSTVSVVRFTWDGGWIDFWIDDVTFYRHKK